jgi:hypothetical protein
VTDLAPDRGELIVDMDALALDARPVEDDYVRPRDRRPPNPSRARKPKGGTGAAAPTDPAPPDRVVADADFEPDPG